VVVAGRQMKWSVSPLISEVCQWQGLQDGLAQLCMSELRCPVQDQLPTLRIHPIHNGMLPWSLPLML
jgi:hypothetical protein